MKVKRVLAVVVEVEDEGGVSYSSLIGLDFVYKNTPHFLL